MLQAHQLRVGNGKGSGGMEREARERLEWEGRGREGRGGDGKGGKGG